MTAEVPNLMARIEAARKALDELGIDFTIESPEQAALTTMAELGLPDCDPVDISIGDVLSIADELDNISGGEEFLSSTRLIFPIEDSNDRAFHFCYLMEGKSAVGVRHLATEAEIGGHIIKIGIAFGFTPYAVGVVVDGDYDDYNPPYSESNKFIDITFPKDAPLTDVRAAARA